MRESVSVCESVCMRMNESVSVCESVCMRMNESESVCMCERTCVHACV